MELRVVGLAEFSKMCGVHLWKKDEPHRLRR